MKRLLTAGLIVLMGLMALIPNLSLAPTVTSADSVQPLGFFGRLAQRPVQLHTSGVTVVDGTGKRLVFAGVNMEMFRDYDGGCGYVTDGQYKLRGVFADRVKALGVNAVRLNYSYRFLNTGDNLTKYLDMATELAQRGIYVMPADHTYTGGVLTNSSGSFPMMLKIVQGMRDRGLEDYLIMGGWNEPGPDISIDAWKRAYQNLLTYLRTTAAYDGLVVIDGTGWSTLLDVTAFKALMTFDAGLRGGTANVIFSHHLYPNITDLPPKIWDAAGQVPLMIGELGQENPGASPLEPQYVKNTIASFLNAGMANGHNGLFAWILAWCDVNAMIEDDWTANGEPSNEPYTANSPLTSHGVLWRDSYYSKLPGATIPVSTVIVQQPSPTPTRTAPLPTNTRAPTRTRTPTAPPVTVITNTPTALMTAAPTRTPSGIETYHILGKVGSWDVDLWIERVR